MFLVPHKDSIMSPMGKRGNPSGEGGSGGGGGGGGGDMSHETYTEPERWTAFEGFVSLFPLVLSRPMQTGGKRKRRKFPLWLSLISPATSGHHLRAETSCFLPRRWARAGERERET